ncbi:secernin-3 [Latimeria chalumnae]|uniref:Secernin 3 n=1 Tax=Latimeria chalumnae TaxID=7897 RepID=H3A518_LATCH|nr:PREDICTED: secernin-3 isoform X2 [Latimeria chalumnae]XP_006003583.1 PREDICTED: secernin-3 isoform X2 [Latimeria chalumnae]XP_006003584.1 PREDICTED: secernin-3 isoform X2 [Latimeria chalumnae]|eukprot:XP_006003582.1 PREDICTED: secernin-3 isoform X2 [Latimeria chalumnae]
MSSGNKRISPRSCDTFVALPPATNENHIIFGKNSDRPSDEVQEIVYFPEATHQPDAKLGCTYIEIEQVEKTYAVVLSRPAWLWGAEMGANEHGVCIGNEAVWGKEEISDEEALLGMDLVRLGLERADSAEKALDVIVDLLQKYGQGGNCMEDEASFTYHNSFLIVDRKEAWILETAGKLWAAEKVEEGVRNISNQLSITTKIDREHPEIRVYSKTRGWWDGKSEFNFAAVFSYLNTARIEASGSRYCEGHKLLTKYEGNIKAETMMEILRDQKSGINMEGAFMTTGSMVSILPQDPRLTCVHFFTGTPDPARSIFKPFLFVPNVQPFLKTSSPVCDSEDPVKKRPRFKSKPDRRHELYKKHEVATATIDPYKNKGAKLLEKMKALEKEKVTQVEELLRNGSFEPTSVVHLFSECVEEELNAYK